MRKTERAEHRRQIRELKSQISPSEKEIQRRIAEEVKKQYKEWKKMPLKNRKRKVVKVVERVDVLGTYKWRTMRDIVLILGLVREFRLKHNLSDLQINIIFAIVLAEKMPTTTLMKLKFGGYNVRDVLKILLEWDYIAFTKAGLANVYYPTAKGTKLYNDFRENYRQNIKKLPNERDE